MTSGSAAQGRPSAPASPRPSRRAVERPAARWHVSRVRTILLGTALLVPGGCGAVYLLGRLESAPPDGGVSAGPADLGVVAPDPGDTLLVHFVSGPSRWPDDGLRWAFEGWGLGDAAWRPRAGGASLALDGAPERRPGPFTDAAPAVAGAFGATGRVPGPPAEHTLEVVFRAAADGPLVESAAWGDLALSADQLVWRRGGAEVRSPPLAADAWAHCGASWAAGEARIVCNGVAGVPGGLPAPPAEDPAALPRAHRGGADRRRRSDPLPHPQHPGGAHHLRGGHAVAPSGGAPLAPGGVLGR